MFQFISEVPAKLSCWALFCTLRAWFQKCLGYRAKCGKSHSASTATADRQE